MGATHAKAGAGLVLLVVLAGCTSSGGPEEPLSPGTTGPGGLPLAPGADVPAADAANRSAGAAWLQAHWGAATERVLFDDAVSFFCLGATAEGVLECTTFTLYLPAGAIVAPGSEVLQVVLDASPPPTAPAMAYTLFWNTAAGGDPRSADLVPGEPLSIPIAPEDADAPLQTASWWWFELAAEGQPAGAALDFEGALRIAAVRAATLPDIGAPPDPWQGAVRIGLVDGESRSGTRAATPIGTFCLMCDGSGWTPAEAALVPEGSLLRATLDWQWTGASKPRLEYAHYAVWEWTALEPLEDGDTARTYEFPVLAGEADSPYQTRSLWRFRFALESDAGAPAGSGTVTLVAEAVRPPVA